MSFIEYLQERIFNHSTSSFERIIFFVLEDEDPDADYRTASEIIADYDDVPELLDSFERLWNEYEAELVRLQYEEDQE